MVIVQNAAAVKLRQVRDDIPVVIGPSALSPTVSAVMERYPDLIGEELKSSGAILFRGFGSGDVSEFKKVIQSATPRTLEYTGGTSPRLKVEEGVFTSTEYPAQYPIALHNEMSYHKSWPDLIYFFCVVAPETGGETPIADSRRILEAIPKEIVSEFEARGVRYVRNLINSRVSFGSWQKVFCTEDRSAVEEYCVSRDMEFEWRRNGTLRVSEKRPAVRVHPVSGERVWFNQAHMWHPSNSPVRIDTDLVSEDDLPMMATFGDGGRLDPSMLEEIRSVLRKHTRMFTWRVGDLLLLDNMLVAHGRAPFEGPRRILVAMGKNVADAGDARTE